jgi:poly [ADP-ribose] polymerase 2/3/4
MKIKSQRFGTASFPDEYNVVLIATLNKTDLTGGNNKYYHIEGHASKDGKKFRLYSRYGRVGHDGTEEERIPPTQTQAALKSAFTTLKKSKTSSRKGYVEVALASTKVGSSKGNEKILSDDIRKEKITATEGKKDKKADLKLHRSVERLVDRLYTEAGQAVRRQLSGSLQTTAENPLGTLTLTQIEQGRQVLQEIQKLLTKKPKLKNTAHKDLLDLSNQFYSAIPQTMAKRPTKRDGKKAMDEWLKKMALNDEEKLDNQEELLELLSDVQGMVEGFTSTDIGKKYLEIGCEYTFVEQDDSAFKRVEKFVQSTRSRHHDWGVEVRNIWKMSVKGQKDKHLPTMKKVGNVKPLFHGSRNANILGICKHGLLMRPPGVYVTGSMFGNGLYFADQSSKSEQYSTSRFGGSGRNVETFFLFVADVALGQVKKYEYAQTHLQRPPRGYQSVQGVRGYSLLHNEFIIYTLDQHILQYLIEFRPKGIRW